MVDIPMVDRSKVKFMDDECDIGYREDRLSDGRPYRIELWATNQTTMATVFVSTVGLDGRTSQQIIDYLLQEKVLELRPGAFAPGAFPFTDSAGNEFWSVNVCIGIDDATYADAHGPFHRSK